MVGTEADALNPLPTTVRSISVSAPVLASAPSGDGTGARSAMAARLGFRGLLTAGLAGADPLVSGVRPMHTVLRRLAVRYDPATLTLLHHAWSPFGPRQSGEAAATGEGLSVPAAPRVSPFGPAEPGGDRLDSGPPVLTGPGTPPDHWFGRVRTGVRDPDTGSRQHHVVRHESTVRHQVVASRERPSRDAGDRGVGFDYDVAGVPSVEPRRPGFDDRSDRQPSDRSDRQPPRGDRPGWGRPTAGWPDEGPPSLRYRSDPAGYSTGEHAPTTERRSSTADAHGDRRSPPGTGPRHGRLTTHGGRPAPPSEPRRSAEPRPPTLRPWRSRAVDPERQAASTGETAGRSTTDPWSRLDWRQSRPSPVVQRTERGPERAATAARDPEWVQGQAVAPGPTAGRSATRQPPPATDPRRVRPETPRGVTGPTGRAPDRSDPIDRLPDVPSTVDRIARRQSLPVVVTTGGEERPALPADPSGAPLPPSTSVATTTLAAAAAESASTAPTGHPSPGTGTRSPVPPDRPSTQGGGDFERSPRTEADPSRWLPRATVAVSSPSPVDATPSGAGTTALERFVTRRRPRSAAVTRDSGARGGGSRPEGRGSGSAGPRGSGVGRAWQGATTAPDRDGWGRPDNRTELRPAVARRPVASTADGRRSSSWVDLPRDASDVWSPEQEPDAVEQPTVRPSIRRTVASPARRSGIDGQSAGVWRSSGFRSTGTDVPPPEPPWPGGNTVARAWTRPGGRHAGGRAAAPPGRSLFPAASNWTGHGATDKIPGADVGVERTETVADMPTLTLETGRRETGGQARGSRTPGGWRATERTKRGRSSESAAAERKTSRGRRGGGGSRSTEVERHETGHASVGRRITGNPSRPTSSHTSTPRMAPTPQVAVRATDYAGEVDASVYYPEFSFKTLAPRRDVTRREVSDGPADGRPWGIDRSGPRHGERAPDLGDAFSSAGAGPKTRTGTGTGAGIPTSNADVDRIVDRLYRALERRTRIEHERRGL